MLCMAMMLSVMVVGAGAAFSDQSKIKNTEAVDACVALQYDEQIMVVKLEKDTDNSAKTVKIGSPS